jgi:hypothetical protein
MSKSAVTRSCWPLLALSHTLEPMHATSRTNQATPLLVEGRIPDDDPAWLAALNAPFDDTPDTDQERADIAEARATGRFVSGAEAHRAISARIPGSVASDP